ncbi:MAG: ADP-ribosylglycohydrolase family protein [Clostridiales bacterium]|nr:ADP-ribosylglycohydrolase family protein [Clostridiales bacterium]
MTLSETLYKLRTEAGLSQEQFASKLGVSRQAVQRWERGTADPELSNLAQISKIYSVSLDSLVFGSDTRTLGETESAHKIKPMIEKMHSWEGYSSNIGTEYRQCVEEGLDIEQYKELFEAAQKLPLSSEKEKIADTLFEIVQKAPMKSGYKYDEPSDLEGIFRLRDKTLAPAIAKAPKNFKDKVAGAWYGRICGCLLGKTVEGIKTDELIPLLKSSDNYPMHRYILSTDITEQMIANYKFKLASRCYADKVTSMPADDDTNYTVLYQALIEKYGRDFSPYDVSRIWLSLQPKDAYCTAERVAFCNFVKGYIPPASAEYKNPFREWIGAQIRGDYFGYINPGDPQSAADMAWRDGCIAQTKNGIYGEMFVAAALACAANETDIKKIILGGISQIPETSRLYERIKAVIADYENGVTEKEFFDNLHVRYNENSGHDWCHTISNAEIVVACLLYGGGDYGRSICMAVEQGFDTDCNGAPVGSILGMRGGRGVIDKKWTDPLHGKLSTAIFGIGTTDIEPLIEKTLSHLK